MVQDLTPSSGLVTFSNGEREKQIIISVQRDDTPEPAERFKIQLMSSTATGGAKVEGITEGVILIEDSDNMYGSVQFAGTDRQKLVVVSGILFD